MRFRLLRLLFFLLVINSACFAEQAVMSGGIKQRRVLLLYAERAETPAIRTIDAGVREALGARGGVEIFTEYFDFARFPADRHAKALIELLHDRYAAQSLDLVVTVGYESLRFTVQKRDELFPGVEIAYCGIERHQLEGKPLPPDVTGVPLFYDFRRTVDLALTLQPGAREVACVFGSGEFDRQVGSEALAALALHPGLRVRRMDGITYDDVMTQIRHLTADCVVLYVSMLRDSTGDARLSPGVVRDLCAASPVPVYGVAAHHLECGLLGGAMMDYTAHGRQMGALAVARLDGRSITPQNEGSSPLLINWLALEKWKVPQNRIPAGAAIRFKPPSLWQEHRGLIVGLFSIVMIQSALIASLLLHRASRRRTERALAESTERMNLAADAANVGMWIWDVSGDDAWMTERGRELFGIEPDARIDYAAVFDRIHEEDREMRETALKRALMTQGEYEMEYRVQSEDGRVRWVSARGRCVGSNNGTGKKLLGVSMDITSRKEADLKAEEERAEFAHLSRVALVGEMATSLAHELNQPLTAIVTNAGAALRFLARDEMDPVELRDLLDDIASDGRRAGEVIRGIKGMVRKAGSERHLLLTDTLVTDVLRMVRADALAHGCTLATELDPALPPILGDAVQLQQVLLNLIINAFDAMNHTPRGSCRVEIGSRCVDSKDAEISVRDFGPGLPLGGTIRIFERFFSTKGEGMGMGLAIARSIVEAHGGTLGGENADGGGARFWFRIPIHAPLTEEIPK